MAAKDYDICPCLAGVYIAKRNKKYPIMMSEDRRLITENEIMMIIDWYMSQEYDKGVFGIDFDSHLHKDKKVKIELIDKLNNQE